MSISTRSGSTSLPPVVSSASSRKSVDWTPIPAPDQTAVIGQGGRDDSSQHHHPQHHRRSHAYSVVSLDTSEDLEGDSSQQGEGGSRTRELVPYDGSPTTTTTEVCRYRNQALGYTTGSVAPFTHKALLEDSSWDFMFQYRGRRVGHAASSTPHEGQSPEHDEDGEDEEQEFSHLTTGGGPFGSMRGLGAHGKTASSSSLFGDVQPLSMALTDTGHFTRGDFAEASAMSGSPRKSILPQHRTKLLYGRKSIFAGRESIVGRQSIIDDTAGGGGQRSSFLGQHSLATSFRALGRRSMAHHRRVHVGGEGARGYLNLSRRPMESLPALLDSKQKKVEMETREHPCEREALRETVPDAIHRLTSLSRPNPPRTEKQRKQWAGNMLRWAIGKVIANIRSQRQSMLDTATRVLEKLRRDRDARTQKADNAKRTVLAAAFFTDMVGRIRSGKAKAARLDKAKYFNVKAKYATICGNQDLVLSIPEVTALLAEGNYSLDPLVFKKLDRDHSGTVEFDELLRAMFPIYTMREIHIMSAAWEKDSPSGGSQQLHREEGSSRLSEDSKQRILNIFKFCDKGRKGVLTKPDIAVIAPAHWDSSKYFPTSTSVLTLEDFTELVKYGFPPYSEGEFVMERLEGAERRNPFPTELILAQEKATSSLS